VPISRAGFRELAGARLREATALCRSREWSGVYYLSGYAIECGLKAAIAKNFRASEFPDKKHVDSIHTHKLDHLVRLAGLEQRQILDFQSDPDMELNWQVVKDWNEVSRYTIWPEPQAVEMFNAISDRRHGIMKWLRSVW